jgi:hypothetical protein
MGVTDILFYSGYLNTYSSIEAPRNLNCRQIIATYSTVTLFAKFRGLSTSVPRKQAV